MLKSAIQIVVQAYVYELYQIPRIFISLIVTNYIILDQADTFSNRNSLFPSISEMDSY